MRTKEKLKVKSKILWEKPNMQIRVWLEPSLHEFIKKEAKKNDRAISSHIRWVLKQYHEL